MVICAGIASIMFSIENHKFIRFLVICSAIVWKFKIKEEWINLVVIVSTLGVALFSQFGVPNFYYSYSYKNLYKLQSGTLSILQIMIFSSISRKFYPTFS
jgi:hypothetical protein